MRIAFYGGQVAGIITLLTLQGTQHEIQYVFPEDAGVATIAHTLNLPTINKQDLNLEKTIAKLSQNIDLFVCCHGRKIISAPFVQKIRCINLHPCLYKYKGVRPIERLIKDNNSRASVAAHWMVPEVDAGQTIVEKFISIPQVSQKTPADIYALLYPLYVDVLLEALHQIS